VLALWARSGNADEDKGNAYASWAQKIA